MVESYGAILRRRGVDDALAGPLEVYLELLERWNRTHNLVRFTDREQLVERHVLESLAGVRHLPEGAGLLVDLGSGAGLPGVPLLVAARGWRGLLIEPRTKRWAFLRTVIRELGLDAEALECRYEDAPVEPGSAGAVVSRALGGHVAMLRWARGHLAIHGKVLFWLGLEEVHRLETIPGWRVVTSPLPGLDRGRLACLEPCFT